MKSIVSFKGISSGCLEISCDEVRPYNAIREALIKKIEQNTNFFRGATSKVLIDGRNFEENEKHEIKEIFLRRFGLLNVVFESCVQTSRSPCSIGSRRYAGNDTAIHVRSVRITPKHPNFSGNWYTLEGGNSIGKFARQVSLASCWLVSRCQRLGERAYLLEGGCVAADQCGMQP